MRRVQQILHLSHADAKATLHAQGTTRDDSGPEKKSEPPLRPWFVVVDRCHTL
jgi:hypothetical protein